MCLTIPKKVLEKRGDFYIVEKNSGEKQEVKTIIKIRVGDFVITQNNVVIQKITKKQAQEINAMLNN
jgi:hydrogenase maturation factor